MNDDDIASVLDPLKLNDPLLEDHHRRGLVEAIVGLPPQVVLSLDGGGVRGIFQARIVQRLISRLREELGAAELDATEAFDVIAGTSTGGILGAGLATPGGALRDASDRASALVTMYEELAAEAFPQRGRVVRSARWATVGKYSSAPLERLLRKQLGEDVQLGQAKTRLVVPAYDLDADKTAWFDSRPRTVDECADVLLWRVARATAAAPTYFAPACIGSGASGHRFVDGGVGANNPTLKAIAIALLSWTDARRSLGSAAREMSPRLPAKVVVVSVGNGTRAPVAPRINGLLGWGLKVSELFGHSSGTAATELAATLPAALREFDVVQRPQPLLNYIRIDPLADRAASLDDASPETLAGLVKQADDQADPSTPRGKSAFECAIRTVALAVRQRQ